MALAATTNECHQALSAKYLSEERLLDAARELAKVDKEDLTKEEAKVIEKAENFEASINVARKGPDPSWTSLGAIKKNGRSFSTSYSINWAPLKADFGLEMYIERSLVLPLLAVLNEVDLFRSWLPKWNTPKFEVVRSETLHRSGLSHQVCTGRIVAPLATVEAYAQLEGMDDTAANKDFFIVLRHLEVGDFDGLVPPLVNGINRVMFNAVIRFSKCPKDKEKEAKALRGKRLKMDEDFVQLNLLADYGNKNTMLKGGLIVRKLANFVMKIVIGMMMNKLISLAEEVREQKRPEYVKAMAAKPVTYEWAKDCFAAIFD